MLWWAEPHLLLTTISIILYHSRSSMGMGDLWCSSGKIHICGCLLFQGCPEILTESIVSRLRLKNHLWETHSWMWFWVLVNKRPCCCNCLESLWAVCTKTLANLDLKLCIYDVNIEYFCMWKKLYGYEYMYCEKKGKLILLSIYVKRKCSNLMSDCVWTPGILLWM